MQNIEKAIFFEKYELNLNPIEGKKFSIEMTNLFQTLSENKDIQEYMDKDIKNFNSSFKDAILEGLKITKLKLNIRIENNQRDRRYNEEMKTHLNKILKDALEEIDLAIIKIKVIRENYKKRIL